MNKIIGFAKQFTNENIPEISNVVKMGRKYNLESESVTKLKNLIDSRSKGQIHSIGLCLGELKDGKFKPTVNFLNIISKHNPAHAKVNKKGETMFLYANSLLAESIISMNRNDGCVLVVNEKNESLGYGSIKLNRHGQLLITNDFNISDFLKREKRSKLPRAKARRFNKR